MKKLLTALLVAALLIAGAALIRARCNVTAEPHASFGVLARISECR